LYHFKKGLSSKKRKKISRPGCGLGTVLESRKSGGIGTEIDGGAWHDFCRAGSMPRHRIRPPRTLFSKKSSLFGKLAHFYCPAGAFCPIANRVQMPINNDNVTGAAVGVAEGVFDSKGNDNESIAALGMFWGGWGQAGRRGRQAGGAGRQAGRQAGAGRRGQAGGGRQAGRRGQAGAGRRGQAGRQAGAGGGRQAGGAGAGNEKAPGGEPGAVSGGRRFSPSPL